MTIYIIVILNVIIFALLFSIARILKKYFDNVNSRYHFMSLEMHRVCILIDLLFSDPSVNVFSKEMFRKITRMELSQIPRDSASLNALVNQFNLEFFNSLKVNLTKDSETCEDPDKKARIEKSIINLDQIFTLLSSLDSSSSPFYRDIVQGEIQKIFKDMT